jgi:lipopolysaccharide/colanic/teichoic acid biosynthesis glycosyltransferase
MSIVTMELGPIEADGPDRRVADVSARVGRLGERAVAALALALTSPVIALALLLVKLTSRGPMFYSQARLGLNGKRFLIYKIRTMCADAERGTGPRWSAPGDPRVTAVGRWLRASHLDELPQLWNVVRGEMAVVGPRPERPEIAQWLEQAIPDFAERTGCLPGITGLAQIQLPPDTDLESVRRKLACDLFYLRARGPWLDLRILAGTVARLLGVPPAVSRRLLAIPAWDALEPPTAVEPARA